MCTLYASRNSFILKPPFFLLLEGGLFGFRGSQERRFLVEVFCSPFHAGPPFCCNFAFRSPRLPILYEREIPFVDEVNASDHLRR